MLYSILRVVASWMINSCPVAAGFGAATAAGDAPTAAFLLLLAPLALALALVVEAVASTGAAAEGPAARLKLTLCELPWMLCTWLPWLSSSSSSSELSAPSPPRPDSACVQLILKSKYATKHGFS